MLTHNMASVNLAVDMGFRFLADIHYSKLFRSKKWIWEECTYEKRQPGKSSTVAVEPQALER